MKNKRSDGTGHNGLRRCSTAIILLSLLVLVSCTTDYVTGKRTFSLVSESQEVEMGREADPQIIAEYGLFENENLAAYVNGIGQRIAAVSQRSGLKYTVRVVDSPIVNAFALPGGYVYITRGILAHFNSEDELAGVMGHEIGHVVARHGAEQMSRAQLASLGLGLGSALSETFARYASVAGTGVGLLFLNFSRSQESEADVLGVEYSTKIGYDAHQMAGFFRTLKTMSAQSGQSLPSFLSTHPDPGDRETRVHQLANEWQGKVAYMPLNKSRGDYLKKIDGIVYGPDPRQGFVENNMFFHPQLAFKFPVPAGWKYVNTASTVTLIEANESAFVQLSMGKAATAALEADEFAKSSEITVNSRKAKKIHGFDAVVVESVLKKEDGDLGLLSCFVRKEPNVYVFHGVAGSEDLGKFKSEFTKVMDGFDRVTSRSVLNKKPRRLGIKSVQATNSLRNILRSLGTDEKMLKELAVLNGRALDDRIIKGELIKYIRD